MNFQSEPKNILVVKLGAIGDVIQSLPVIEQLKANFPGCKIHWLIEDKAFPAVQFHPDVNFIVFNKSRIKSLNLLHSIPALASFLKELRSSSYDIALDLQGLFKSGILARLSQAKKVIGFHRSNTREGNHVFMDIMLSPLKGRSMHRIDFYLQTIPFLGKRLQDLEAPFNFTFTETELRLKRQLLHRFRVKNPIIFNLGASKATKRWPDRYFAQLALKVREKFPKSPILLCGNGFPDANSEREILKMVPPGTCVSAVNKTTLRELALLIKHSAFLVSADSAALHLGSAFDIPSVGLFGGSALAIQTGPYNPDSQGLDFPLGCYPCRKKTCSHMSCMEGITPERAFSAILDLELN